MCQQAVHHQHRRGGFQPVAALLQVFRFCAIPQVMAIGTLALCYNNHEVFTGSYAMAPALSHHVVIAPGKIVLCCSSAMRANSLDCVQ